MIALISGGMDSPVAAYMIGRLGYRIIPVYFDNSPFSDNLNQKKTEECVKRLKEHITTDPVKVISNGQNLLEISEKCNRKYTCVLCRRMMFRITEKLCENLGSEAIVTGEFLGSKASQTLQNLEVVSQAVEIPIIRPLLGMDKEEIKRIGRKIGTFYQGFSPAGCCSVVPRKPSTKAKLEKILEEEKKLDLRQILERTLK
jgi:thiamine biosynthesis protein ThiI